MTNQNVDAMTEQGPCSPLTKENEPPPRLMITKMELENFKSYAGIREIGPFHKCFSSVVGPNGSGKSNVIDAMLFVFGKRAKKLRLNKVSELIHKSDAVKANPPQYARVSVFFQEIVDQGNDYRIIPDTETVVTRIARKDNSSQYKLNGKNCQFREVAQYLGDKGIDLDNNRFLILQGEVEMISMMPPKGKNEGDEGLLEYLEEIIGSNKFVEQTNKIAEQLESLNEQRQEKLNRVKAVEKEKDSLESAKLEAEALLGKEREIRRQKNILYQIHKVHVAREIDDLTIKKETLQEKLKTEQQQLQESNQRMKSIEDGLSNERKEYDKIFKELTKTKEEFSAFERRDIKLREEIKHCKKASKAIEGKIAAEIKKHDDALFKAKEAEESIPQLEEQIDALQEQKVNEDEKLEKILEEVKCKTKEIRNELEQKTQQLAPIKQELAVFEAQLSTAETEVRLLEDSTTRAKEKLTAAEKELASLDEKQAKKRMECLAGQDEVVSTKARIKQVEKELASLAEKESQLSKRNIELLAKVEVAKAEMNSIGAARSPAVQGILKAAQKGGDLANVGIVGRLGDLAFIDEKYDVAVSTACTLLDHIVVQTTAGAQRCLDFLRKKDLGRANFIPLDKMKKGAHDQVPDTPEGAPRLFELITPKDFSVTPAIFLGVKHTLVAPDLETATRWAYEYGKRWRVVTLDGNLIETAGTMSGGGKSVRRGGMRLRNERIAGINKNDDSQILDCEKLQQEASKAQQLVQECRNGRKALSDELKALAKKLKEMELQLPKLQIEIDGCDTTRAELNKLIPSLRSQCSLSKEDTKKHAELLKKVENCRSDMTCCQQQASTLEADVSRLQQCILDAGGSRLKKQQANCEKLLSKLNEAEKALKAAKVAISSSEKIASKAISAKEAAERELESNNKSIENKKSELEALEKDALVVTQAYEKVKMLEEEKRNDLEERSKEYDDLKRRQTEAKCVEVDLVARITEIKKQISECLSKSSHWDNEILSLNTAAENDDDLLDENEATSTENDDINNNDDELADAGTSGRALPTLSAQMLEKYDPKVVKEQISILESERSTIAKNANMGAISEYRKKEADYLTRVAELDNVNEECNEVRKVYDDLRRQRLEIFMDGFGQITLKLKEMYQMITLGGDAELELVDSLDPFSEGIVFSVRPPKKSWKNISNLSGGEKTLSSLALVFALHHFKPTPLYVLDEIDAALDFKNVSIVANYIKERTKNAQFIIISLRNNMFELADRLVGIYKTNNCTKSVTINPEAFGVSCHENSTSSGTPALVDRSNGRIRNESVLRSVDRRVSFSLNT